MNTLLCITDWLNAISALFSTIFAGCMVYYAYRQTKRQTENVKISLFHERSKVYEPIQKAYSLYERGLLNFFYLFCSENKNKNYPMEAVAILRQIKDYIPQLNVLFGNEMSEQIKNFADKYERIVDKSCELCTNLAKVPKGTETFNIWAAVVESNSDEELTSKFEDIADDNEKQRLLPLYKELKQMVKEFTGDNSIKKLIDKLNSEISIAEFNL